MKQPSSRPKPAAFIYSDNLPQPQQKSYNPNTMNWDWFKRIRPWQLGGGGGIVTALVLGYGWYKCGESLSELGLAVGIGVAVGFTLFLLAKLRWRAWQAVFGVFALIGLGSAVELLFETPFERQCFVALATMLFWLVLGLSVGMLAEFIRFLDRLVHRLLDARLDRSASQTTSASSPETDPPDQT
jgi:hypothetical protein